jgi:hypothetical protein
VAVEPEGWGKPRAYVTPSSGGGECPLQIQLGMLGYSSGFSARSKARMANGSQVHERVQGLMHAAGVLVGAEVRLIVFADGYCVSHDVSFPTRSRLIKHHGRVTWSGYLDAVVGRSSEATTVYVGEIKSMNSRRFGSLPRQEADKRLMAKVALRAEPSYTRQLVNYIVTLQRHVNAWRPGTTVSNEGFLYFENTDNQDYRILWIDPDETVREDAFTRGRLAEEASARGELLERPFARESRTCHSCYSADVCNRLTDDTEREGDEWTKVRAALSSLRTQMASGGGR